jgi:hypothetical protein
VLLCGISRGGWLKFTEREPELSREGGEGEIVAENAYIYSLFMVMRDK